MRQDARVSAQELALTDSEQELALTDSEQEQELPGPVVTEREPAERERAGSALALAGWSRVAYLRRVARWYGRWSRRRKQEWRAEARRWRWLCGSFPFFPF